jgi:hypothetical protein
MAHMITSSPWVTRKSCTVSFQDSNGVRHAVEVGAETVYEAGVLALKSFGAHDCPPGPAAHLAIEVKNPSLTHTVITRAVRDWLEGGARSPKEAIEKPLKCLKRNQFRLSHATDKSLAFVQSEIFAK